MSDFDDDRPPPRPRPARRGPVRLSFFLVALLPTLLVCAYLMLVAQPRYVSQFRFSIYQPANGSVVSGSGGGSSSGEPQSGDLPGSAPTVANYVVADYLVSPQVLTDLEKRMDLRQLLDNGHGDLIGRYWWGDGSPEQMLSYWKHFVLSVDYDVTTGLTSVSITSYTAADSLLITQALQQLCEDVVNNMSARARQDQLHSAEVTVARADARLRDVLQREQALRGAQQSPNPASDANNAVNYVNTLNESIDSLKAEDVSLGSGVSSSSPMRRLLRQQIAASETRLHAAVARIGGGPTENTSGMGGTETLPAQMSAYEYLEAERSFVSSYDNAMQQLLESARLNLATQHNYLEVYVTPYAPRHATLPRVSAWTLLTFISLCTVWLIGLLVTLSLRDHLPSHHA